MQTEQRITAIEQKLLRSNPNWSYEKRRWLAMQALNIIQRR